MLPMQREKFLDSDYEVAINTVAEDGSEFNSKPIAVNLAKKASLTVYVEGQDAGCTLDVEFKFATFDSERGMWDTTEFKLVTLAPVGLTPKQKTVELAVGIEQIKLLSVKNQETTSGYTVKVNASVFIR